MSQLSFKRQEALAAQMEMMEDDLSQLKVSVLQAGWNTECSTRNSRQG